MCKPLLVKLSFVAITLGIFPFHVAKVIHRYHVHTYLDHVIIYGYHIVHNPPRDKIFMTGYKWIPYSLSLNVVYTEVVICIFKLS